MSWYEFILRNREEVFVRSLEHLSLVAASMAISGSSGGRDGGPDGMG